MFGILAMTYFILGKYLILMMNTMSCNGENSVRSSKQIRVSAGSIEIKKNKQFQALTTNHELTVASPGGWKVPRLIRVFTFMESLQGCSKYGAMDTTLPYSRLIEVKTGGIVVMAHVAEENRPNQ